METNPDYEDLLSLFEKHEVRYLIIGGYAFTFHARPRYTRDIDFWIDPDIDNVERANVALQEFGSPHLLDPNDRSEVVQLGVEPNRIDLLRDPASEGGPTFEEAWSERVRSRFGGAEALWISAEGLLAIKSKIDHPRHQEDARVLREVLEMRRRAREEGSG